LGAETLFILDPCYFIHVNGIKLRILDFNILGNLLNLFLNSWRQIVG